MNERINENGKNSQIGTYCWITGWIMNIRQRFFVRYCAHLCYLSLPYLPLPYILTHFIVNFACLKISNIHRDVFMFCDAESLILMEPSYFKRSQFVHKFPINSNIVRKQNANEKIFENVWIANWRVPCVVIRVDCSERE